MNLFVFGLGYSASVFVRAHRAEFGAVAGTVRAPEKIEAFRREGIEAMRFDDSHADAGLGEALAQSDVLLVSVQPGQGQDPVLARFAPAIAASDRLRTIVYYSTIGVYGDHDGAWIDETAATEPDNARQGARIVAEQAWIGLGAKTGKQVLVLRLAGIYGPGRNALADLAAGEARRIVKPGQVFNRIHVADIARATAGAFRSAGPHRIVNVTDDEPAPAPDVVAYGAGLMGIDPPPAIPFTEANLSPMARSFYGANRRVSNRALKADLGVTLAYPTYRDGLDALWAAGEGRR